MSYFQYNHIYCRRIE